MDQSDKGSDNFGDQLSTFVKFPFKTVKASWNAVTGRAYIEKMAPNFAEEALHGSLNSRDQHVLSTHTGVQIYSMLLSAPIWLNDPKSLSDMAVKFAATALLAGWAYAAYEASHQRKHEQAQGQPLRL